MGRYRGAACGKMLPRQVPCVAGLLDIPVLLRKVPDVRGKVDSVIGPFDVCHQACITSTLSLWVYLSGVLRDREAPVQHALE